MKLFIGMVLFMSIEAFSQVDDWDNYNSSLLIEVTRPSGVFTCTGVALSPKTVVTAAHCLEGEINGVRVFTQASYDPKQPSLAISEYKIHPNYNPSLSRYKSDIAKIVMEEKLPPSIHIHSVFKGNMVSGTIYRFGFGERNNTNIRTVVTPKLRRLNIQDQVLELDDMYSRSGDSGGPIFMKKGQDIKLLAIHSTFSHGPQGEFSLNPRLEAYLNWIFEH